jgi:hypothetical protein
MMGSSEIQPFGLNSTVDPSLCRHLKQKFTEPDSKQIACEDAFVDKREGPSQLEDGLKIQAFLKKQNSRHKSEALGCPRNAWSEFEKTSCKSFKTRVLRR